MGRTQMAYPLPIFLILFWYQVLGVSLDTLMSPEEEGEEEQEEGGEELETLSAVQSITATPTMCLGKTRAGILGH